MIWVMFAPAGLLLQGSLPVIDVASDCSNKNLGEQNNNFKDHRG